MVLGLTTSDINNVVAVALGSMKSFRFLNPLVRFTYAGMPEWPNGTGLGFSEANANDEKETCWLSAYWGSNPHPRMFFFINELSTIK